MQPVTEFPSVTTGLLTRHPLDPEPVRDTKARAVLALGIFAAVTGFLLGGLIPAGLAFYLAGQARREMIASGGFLTGGRQMRAGVILAWVGVVAAAIAVVVALLVGLVGLADAAGARDYPPEVN